jgi:hypothetical protein
MQVLVVPAASAIELTGCNNVSLYANHVEICKPPSKENVGYMKLLEIIKSMRQITTMRWNWYIHGEKLWILAFRF